jgi:imidazolonepropionase-like amidohydrolase
LYHNAPLEASPRKKFTIQKSFGILKQKGCDTVVDCHIHMVLDGLDWKNAIARHKDEPNIPWIRQQLRTYQEKSFTHLRDGGDRWGVGAVAKTLAPEYGIFYSTPLAPLCKTGHYGGFIGKSYANMREYSALVQETRRLGGDFIKIMISGLMDFNVFGVLTETPLPKSEIQELIHIAHEEGFAVMAHANGARTMEAAAEAGVDSIEHGAYSDEDALAAMVENGTVWVPTLSTIGNLRGAGRFSEKAVAEILDYAMEQVSNFAGMGGLIAPGTDAGAWAVPHGSTTEYQLLTHLLGDTTGKILEPGIRKIFNT